MQAERPQLWVFAGPSGAGKSTLVAGRLRDRLPIVTPDVIAVEISRDHPDTPAIMEAGKIAVKRRLTLLSELCSFAIETTLSGSSEIRLMRDAANLGYKVNLVFVGLRSGAISQGRFAHRVRMGLHYVPPEDILRRYQRSMDNLPVAMGIAARTLVIDNTGRGFRLGAGAAGGADGPRGREAAGVGDESDSGRAAVVRMQAR
jgi:predicted ABC-type ATPase